VVSNIQVTRIKFCKHLIFHHAFYMSRPFYPPRCDHPNNIWYPRCSPDFRKKLCMSFFSVPATLNDNWTKWDVSRNSARIVVPLLVIKGRIFIKTWLKSTSTWLLCELFRRKHVIQRLFPSVMEINNMATEQNAFHFNTNLLRTWTWFGGMCTIRQYV
jgi:hypothetical protein